mgnify:CR=1 FL=1|jgi:hypothetical protein
MAVCLESIGTWREIGLDIYVYFGVYFDTLHIRWEILYITPTLLSTIHFE